MASGELGPKFAGMELALHARIHAAVNAGIPREQILSHEGLTPESWERADARWQQALAESAEGDAQLLEQWDGAVAAASGQFTRRVHPIEDEIEAWVDLVRHCQASDDFIGALQATGIGMSDWLQLQAYWNARTGVDAELCQRMAERLSGPAASPPKLSFDPISMPPPLHGAAAANPVARLAAGVGEDGDETNRDATNENQDEDDADDPDDGDEDATSQNEDATATLPEFEVPAAAPSDRGVGGNPISPPAPGHDPAEIPEFLRRSVPAPPPYASGLAVPAQAPSFGPEFVEPVRVPAPPPVPQSLSSAGESSSPGPVPRVPGTPTTQPMAVVLPTASPRGAAPALPSNAPASAVMPPPVWPSEIPSVPVAPPPVSQLSAPGVPNEQVTSNAFAADPGPSAYQSRVVGFDSSASLQKRAPGVRTSSEPPARELPSISPTEIPLVSQPPPIVPPPIVTGIPLAPPPAVSGGVSPIASVASAIMPPAVVGVSYETPPMMSPPPVVGAMSPAAPPMMSPPPVVGGMSPAAPPMMSPPPVMGGMSLPLMPLSERPAAIDPQSVRVCSEHSSAPMASAQVPAVVQPPVATPFEVVPIAPHVPITPLPVPPAMSSAASVNVADKPMAIMPPPVVPLGALPVVPPVPASLHDHQQSSSHHVSESALGARPRAGLVMPPTVIPDGFAPKSALPLERHAPTDAEQQLAPGAMQPQFGPPPSERFISAASASGISFSSSSGPPVVRGSEQYQRALQASDALSAPPGAGGGTRAVELPPEFQAMLRGQPLSASERPTPAAEPPRVAAPMRFASQPPPVEPNFPHTGASRSVPSTSGVANFAPPPVVAPPPAVVLPKAPSSPLPATELKPLKKLPWEK